jgi:hypothetical protein
MVAPGTAAEAPLNDQLAQLLDSLREFLQAGGANPSAAAGPGPPPAPLGVRDETRQQYARGTYTPHDQAGKHYGAIGQRASRFGSEPFVTSPPAPNRVQYAKAAERARLGYDDANDEAEGERLRAIGIQGSPHGDPVPPSLRQQSLPRSTHRYVHAGARVHIDYPYPEDE